MPHLRLVTDSDVADPIAPSRATAVDDRPRVSLRLLMAASGRCSCDGCLLSYRAGNRGAGVVAAPARPALTAVR